MDTKKGWMGNLSDKMDVASAKLRNDDAADIEVAIVKATLNDEVVPKEKHVRSLKVASSASAPRTQVNLVISGLGARLDDHKSSWLVTLKTLIVFHRLLREVDPSFQEEMLKFCDRGSHRRMLRLDGFADHETKDTWDISAWIRVYSVYLDERLELFRVMQFDPEQDENAESKLKVCSTAELLERMPLAHKLMTRLIACVPQGAAANNAISVQACGLVLKEVRAVYKLVCEGVMNLADKFFDMERNDAVRGLELYKENVALNDRLNAFFNTMNNIGSMKNHVQYPTLQALPTDFLSTLEDYVKDAPKMIDPSSIGSARKTGAAAAPPAYTRTSTVARQGGVTSDAIAGEGGVVSVPAQGVLKLGVPVGSSVSTAAAPAVDLLGTELEAVSLTPTGQQAPVAAAAAPLVSENSFFSGAWTAPAATHAAPPAPAAGSPFGDSAFGASPAAPPPAGAPIHNPHQQQQYSAPAPAHMAHQQQQQQQYGAPSPAHMPQQAPPGQNPFSQFGAPAVAPSSYAPQHQHSFNGHPPAPLGNPFGAPAAAGNPYAGFTTPAPGPAYGAPPPQQAGFRATAAWNPAGSMSFPSQAPASHVYGGPAPAAAAPAWSNKDDPLGALSMDVLGGKPNQQAPKPSLMQMRGQPGSSSLI